MNIVGPLLRASGNNKFVILTTDYFTKWVEAKTYVSITQDDVVRFVWQNIICRFGIPKAIETANETLVDNRRFRNCCTEKGITLQFSSKNYPQGNGQLEKTNRTIFYCLKKKLEQRKGMWHGELPNVLWAYRTTKRKPIGEKPILSWLWH